MNIQQFITKMEDKIKDSYEAGITLEDAEKLSAEFLYAQLKISEELKAKDLDSRMRKQGVKAIRAALYTEACSKADKKPTEAQLTAMLDVNDLVSGEQSAFDVAEVERDELDRAYSVFQAAHVYYRQISRGSMG